MSSDGERAWYSIFKAKDARYDGRFFVGVISTGIYCRPVCRAKLPKMENCAFHASAASAERAGFRPCLLCRPELAPGAAPIDAAFSLARRAARLIEDCCGEDGGVEELAKRLGCGGRHLRRAFMAEYHVTPVRYLQTCRLLLAKSLLTDTGLSAIRVAMASGFGSLRRFNDLFKKQYRLSPTALRKRAKNENDRPAGVTLTLGYRPPYQWDKLLAFLEQRAVRGVETVAGGEYARVARFATEGGKELRGWLRVRHDPDGNALKVVLDSELLPVLPRVLGRIRHLFDLYCNPDVVYGTLEAMNGIRDGLCLPGLRMPGSFDPFETAVRAVLGQQISVKAARTLAGRLVEKYGVPAPTGIDGLTHAFPTPAEIAGLEGSAGDRFGPLGITGARAKTIRALALALNSGEIDFGHSARPEEEIAKLLGIPGIGAWTAHYIAMRAMGWTDAFPHGDHGVRKALAPRGEKEILALAEAWRPWRGYAVVNLWNIL